MKKRLLNIGFCLSALLGWQSVNAQTAPSLIENNANVAFSGPNSDFTGGITVEAWVNFEVDNSVLWMGQSTPGADNMSSNVWIWHGNQVYVNNGGAWVSTTVPTYPSCLTHVAFTADANGITVFYNGVQVAQTATPVTAIVNNPASEILLGIDPRFSAGTPGRFSNIPIDEFAVWSVARTPMDIANSYLNSLKGKETGLVQYTKFEEGTGVNCKSLVGPQGTLVNTSGWTGGYIPANEFYNIDFQGLGGTNERYTLGISGDYDGDGDVDFVCQDEVLNWRLFTNDGSGTFTSVVITSGLYSSITAGDIDNDGDLDLISGTGLILKNDGVGNFTMFNDLLLPGRSSVIIDVDGDNDNDVVFSNSAIGDSVIVYKNDGLGNFTLFQSIIRGLPGSNISVGDIDGDNDIDLVLSQSSWSGEVFVNDGTGLFTSSQVLGGYHGGSTFVDMDNDGDLDIVLSDGYNAYGTRFDENDGAGNFASSVLIMPYSSGGQGYYYHDFNNDGFYDIAHGTWGGNGRVWLNDGSMSFTEISHNLLDAGNGLCIGDYNGDGSLDIFCQARDAKSSVFLNNMNGPLSTTREIEVTGNGLVVLSGSTATSTLDNTDFGNKELCTGAVTNSFVIENRGLTDLVVTGATLTGTNASDYMVVGASFPQTLVYGATLTISVDFTSGAIGPRTASLDISSDDCDEPIYSFSIIGTGTLDVSAPTADVTTLSDITAECSVSTPSAPTATDGCSGVITGTTTTIFPITAQGTTPVTWTYDDGNGNTSTQMQNIVITDVTNPTITAPAAVSVSANAANCSATGVALGTETAADNCGTPVVTNDAPATFPLGNTTVTWTATDAAGLTATATQVVTVTSDLAIASSPIITNTTCNGDTDGAINITVTGGTMAYSYSWDNSATTEDLTGLGAGSYFVTVSDVNGCTDTITIAVTEPTAIALSATVTDETLGSDGTVDLTVTGGIPSYTFAWDNSATTEDISSLVAGTYFVTVTDANGCTDTLSVTLFSQVGIAENGIAAIVYPNPTNGIVTIEFEQMLNGTITVLDGIGKIVSIQRITNVKQTIDLSNNERGIYFLQISKDDARSIIKIILE